MEYSEAVPRPVLARHIECFWFLAGETPAGAPVERILPDGRNEIVFNLSDSFTRLHPDGSEERHPVTLLVGPIQEVVTLRPGRNLDVVGVRFWPGGLYPFMALPMAETVNHLGPLGHVSSSLAPGLAERLHGTPSQGSRVALLNAHFTRLLPPRTKRQALVEATVGRILDSDGTIAVKELSRTTSVGPRQLERVFREHVGLAPKLLARIIRFQSVFGRIGQQLQSDAAPNSWSRVAHSCGYFDQAHMIADFKRFAGSSPVAYFADAHDLSDHFTGIDLG